MAIDLPAEWQDCTVPKMFAWAVARRGGRTALMYKDYGIWQRVSWTAYGERAAAVGLGLAALGLRPGECVGILVETRHEWLYADMGIQGVGAISVGLYPTSSREQVEYILGDCQARMVVVEDDEQLDKVLECLERLPHLQKVVVIDMDGLGDFQHANVLSFQALTALGTECGSADPGGWGRACAQARPQDDAILVYTSGTTGPPKGARLTHRNLAYQAWAWQDVAPTGPNDQTLAFLPLCHVAERVMTALRPLAYEGVVNFTESADAVLENLREVQPTVFIAVPRIWEKLHSIAAMTLADATAMQRWVYRQAIHAGGAVAQRRLARRPVPLLLRALRQLADWVALNNTRRMLGLGRCRLIGSGAAPISPEVIRWYLGLGIDMIEMYGQTESSGVATAYPPEAVALHSVGRAVRGTELRIAPDGEILIRGPGVFAGYRNKPEKTAEALQDGWLHTGDIGTLDAAGNLRLTDRKSDIMITSGGKNITPTEIENKLKFSAYITDAVVIGDGRKYLTCLVMIDHDNVAKYAQDRRIAFSDYASLTRLQQVRDLIGAEIDTINAGLNNVESIKKFSLIEVQLTAQDEEMTPTLKLKRRFVSQKYSDLIEGMYRIS